MAKIIVISETQIVVNRQLYKKNIKYFECINKVCHEDVVDLERAVMPNGDCPSCKQMMGMILKPRNGY